eukprot:CAMPEP_0116008346 /NCGR_PEP_ID=MMETSP0321-20121206/2812_1 /TAXON_ID=163516 /ORGANISM="Leptocylindrus danicus var. danicus, Strain B650" /LENGTH=282 /DNA_ID=CAMNT_0003477159 /DNA_START=70 /DNA_END=918 /DNA_ORIENTATION=-
MKSSTLFAAILTYIIIGVWMYSSVVEDWPVLDALYFSVVTLTTVGYGDFYPTNQLSKLVFIFYALTGIAVFGMGLELLGETLAKRAKSTKNNPATSALLGGKSNVIITLVPFVMLTLGAYYQKGDEDWTLVDALYFGVVTATTIGYGDMTTSSSAGKVLGLLFIPVTVAAMTVFLSSIADRIAKSVDSSEDDDNALPSLTKGHFVAMRKDAKGGQAVSKEAFLEYMLLNSGKVDQKFLDKINDSFKSLDTDRKGLLYSEDFSDVPVVMNKADVSVEMKKKGK